MARGEQGFVLLAFLLVGAVVGYVTFLIFRIAENQQRFNWSGAILAITTLAGGGFLSYRSQPRDFAAYGVGFFVGFIAYWLGLQFPDRIVTGSRVARSTTSSGDVSTLGSQAAPSGDSVPEFGVRLNPDTGRPMPRTLSTEERVKAVLALRTQEHSENISVTASLRDDLHLCDFDLCILFILLRVGLPEKLQPSERLNTVKDLINLIDDTDAL